MQQSAHPSTLSEVYLSQTDPNYRSYQQTYAHTLLPGSAPWTACNSVGFKGDVLPNHIRRYEVDQRRTDDEARFRDALLHHGSRGDCLHVDSHLLDRPNVVNTPIDFDQGGTLHVAAMRGHSDLAHLLIQRRANVNQHNHARQTPLHVASEGNQGIALMEFLVAGGDADRRDQCKQTPLHRAAFAGAEDVLQALLDYGANARLRDEGGLMPLHKAATMGREGAISMLLERDPMSVNEEAADGWTALHLAAHGGHAAACESLLAYGADASLCDSERMTPLHRAATSGNAVSCQVLCRGGADIQARDVSGNTPLHTACEEGHALVARALLSLGAPLDALDRMRRTPLHVATAAGHVEICDLLISYGADPTAMDIPKGVPSPLAVARRNRNSELIALFEAALQRNQNPPLGSAM